MNRHSPFLRTLFLVTLFLVCGPLTDLNARPILPRIGGLPPNVLRFEPLSPSWVGPTLLTFNALGRHFELQLELNDLFTPDAQTLWIGDRIIRKKAPQAIFYKGAVKGDPESWVRLSLQNGAIDGMIRTTDEIYFVEAGRRFFAGSSPYAMVIYRLSDTVSDWGPGSCALEDPTVRSELESHATATGSLAEYKAAVAELRAAVGSTTLEQLDLGIVADYEYYQAHGAASATALQNIINQVDGIYRSEVGVTLRVAKTVVYTTVNDPFTSTTDPTTLLKEFSAYKNKSTSPVYNTGLAHLFTSRELDGNVIGIAWLDTLCEKQYGTGLSQEYTSANKSLTLLSAHEIGHNFSAPHDNQQGSACASTPFGFIMNPWIDGNLQLKFSSCSKEFINGAVGFASCMQTVGGTTAPAHIGTFRPS
ncbi:MAG TPA: M12 family metallo-peptidase, partial [Candidatus Binatia bacterium]|nr:M12 family metallo-peptidase [Candidatus Binatia bacterium]